MNKRIRNKQQNNVNNNIETITEKSSLKQKLLGMNKKWLFVVINVIVLVGVIIFVKESYAYLYQTLRGEKSYSLKVKGFSLKLDDSSTSENIKIENSVPISDEEGKQTNAYTFSIINEDTEDTGYVLYLDDVSIDNEINRMKDTNMKYQLIENGKETVGLVSELGTSPFRILTNGVIGGNQTNNYSLRFWIKEDAEVPAGQVFNVKIRVIATSKEAIAEGKLVYGETIITSDSGITQMTSDELQTYINKSLDENKRQILDEVHPVGSIYISEIDNSVEKVQERFGGTWERYAEGTTLVGANSKYPSGTTGGSDRVTLTINNLPAHNHAIPALSGTTDTAGNHRHFLGIGNALFNVPGGTQNTFAAPYAYNIKDESYSKEKQNGYDTDSSGAHTHSLTTEASFTGSSGLGNSFSVQNPYSAIYMYKRIA